METPQRAESDISVLTDGELDEYLDHNIVLLGLGGFERGGPKGHEQERGEALWKASSQVGSKKIHHVCIGLDPTD